MKKSFTTDAINLKNYPLNYTDSIVVMFSKSKVLIRAVAKGAKSPKSKIGSRIQMFIANRLMLNEGKNLDTIAQAQSINTFYKIRNDLDKLSYSMYIAEIINNFCSNEFNQDENNDKIYDLIFSAYEKIATSEKKEEVLLTVLKFQIKIMALLGWGLDFCYCSSCQKEIENNAIYNPTLGSFICEECQKSHFNPSSIKIHSKIKMFLNEISKKDFLEETKYDNVVTLAILDKCVLFMKKYIDNLSNKKTKIFEVLDSLA